MSKLEYFNSANIFKRIKIQIPNLIVLGSRIIDYSMELSNRLFKGKIIKKRKLNLINYRLLSVIKLLTLSLASL